MKAVFVITKIVGFAIAVLWTLGVVYAGLIFFGPFSNTVATTGYTNAPLVVFCQFWYLFTCILVAVLGTIRGFAFIGKWDYSGSGDTFIESKSGKKS